MSTPKNILDDAEAMDLVRALVAKGLTPKSFAAVLLWIYQREAVQSLERA